MLTKVSFNEIVDCIVCEMKIKSFDVKRGNESYLRCCLRPVFTLDVSAETFDLFFNSPFGYRAQYYADPDDGQKQNNRLITKLVDSLIEYSMSKSTKESLTEEQIRRSLCCCSAKIWISEDEFEFNLEIREQIIVLTWREYAKQAKEAFTNNRYPEPREMEKAIWGIRAPTGTTLDVKGAFIDPDDNEVVPRSKTDRRFEIQRYGFT